MKRTKPSAQQFNRIQTLGAIKSRLDMAAKLGYQYSGDRDVYEALGYKKTLNYSDYEVQYRRQDIAKAVVNRPVEATWRGDVQVLGPDDNDKLKDEWNALQKDLKLKSKFVRLDKLSSLGHYGILFLGLSDVKNTNGLSQPIEENKELELLYLKPLGEDSAKVEKWNKNPQDKRYSLPEIYRLTIAEPDGDATHDLLVHYSRVLHITGELLESEVQGVPYLEAVFDRLKDLEKVVGGGAEMFWRGARPGYSADIDEKFQMTDATYDDLQDQIDEYEHNLRRILTTQGVTLNSLDSQVTSPKEHVDVLVQMISAVTGIPKRILTGSERGELSSSQDRDNWLEAVQGRREEYAEPQILEPFIDFCMKHGILTETKDKEYSIQWDDLFSLSDKDRSEIGRNRANALKEYSNAPMAESVMSPKAFLKFVMGFSDDEIDVIEELSIGEINEEISRSEIEEQENV